MKKLFTAALALLLIVLSGCKKDNPKPDQSKPDKSLKVEFIETPLEEIYCDAAVLKAWVSVSNAGSSEITGCFYFGTSSEDLAVKGTKIESDTLSVSDGTFSALVEDLNSETTYYFMAELRVGDKVFVSGVNSFNTGRLTISVTTLPAEAVEFVTGVLRGKVNINSKSIVPTSCGFKISSIKNTLEEISALDSQGEVEADKDNAFSQSLDWFSVNKTYHYVAFAEVNGETYYGELVDFTTQDYNDGVNTVSAKTNKLGYVEITGYLKGDYAGKTFSNGFLFSGTATDLESLKTSGTEIQVNWYNPDRQFARRQTVLKDGTYYYVAYAIIDDVPSYGEVKSVYVKGITQGDYIDMGGSVKWAVKDLGAASITDAGTFYAWGETETKTSFGWDNYKWDGPSNISKYNGTDGKTALDPEDDVVRKELGSNYRMPTTDEWMELKNNCKTDYSWMGNLRGQVVFSKVNSNVMFFPYRGHYENGSLVNTENEWRTWASDNVFTFQNIPYGSAATGVLMNNSSIEGQLVLRCYGLPVRPVEPKEELK